MNETANKQEEVKGEKVKRRTSLKNIIGGDILATDFFRRQTKLLVLIMVLILFYIHNRYACQQQMIEIDKLKKELIDIKYDALTRSSELMERSQARRCRECGALFSPRRPNCLYCPDCAKKRKRQSKKLWARKHREHA